LRKSAKARRIKELMAEGMKPSEIISRHPDLSEGFNELVKLEESSGRRSRGSGPMRSGPEFSDHAPDLEQPAF
jgi:hypothetical protein